MDRPQHRRPKASSSYTDITVEDLLLQPSMLTLAQQDDAWYPHTSAPVRASPLSHSSSARVDFGPSSSQDPPPPDGELYVIPFDDLPFQDLLVLPSRFYRCPVCHMEFSDKRNFRHHYMVHSGEKPYACSFCPYRARQNGTLRNHIIVKHKGLFCPPDQTEQ